MAMRSRPLPASTSGLSQSVNSVNSSGVSTWPMASASGGISGLPDMRRNRSQGTGFVADLTPTRSSRSTVPNPASTAWPTRSRSSKSSMGSAPGGWMESYRAFTLAARDLTGVTSYPPNSSGSDGDISTLLGQADPAAGSQHAVELPQRRRLVGDVDQHRPGGDRVDRGIIHAS